jgi:hypothetical protein
MEGNGDREGVGSKDGKMLAVLESSAWQYWLIVLLFQLLCMFIV